MFLGADFDDVFADAVDILRPYLNDIVCLGGCANALYRYHPFASDVMWSYLGTKDVDMGVPKTLPLDKRPPVAKLMKDIGFEELICGNAEEAVVKYGLGNKEKPVDLEFLCGKSGLSMEDQGRAAYVVQEGLYAQPLRYLEMSFNNTWDVSLGGVSGMERVRDVKVKVPNPAAYVVSKVLIREEQRSQSSMRKDCFYIYEVSVVFRDAFDKIRTEYDQLTPCVPKWKKRFADDARRLFYSETSEGPISAVQIYKDLGSLNEEGVEVSEEMVCRSVNRLLDALLD